jgi:uncharacterized glyoxalase superfamily protein PhnB
MTNKKSIQAYLNFDGKCDEAIALYQKALGAEVRMLIGVAGGAGCCGEPN